MISLQVALARKKLGERALSIEYIMYIVIDAQDTTDFDNTLAPVKTMYVDHGNVAIMKEKLKSAKKPKIDLEDKPKKSEQGWKCLLRIKNELRVDFDNREHALRKEVVNLKQELDKEKKQLEEWEPAVKLSCDKIGVLLPIDNEHSQVCPAFVLVWNEYCKKFEANTVEEEIP